jgi:hypothetical protein
MNSLVLKKSVAHYPYGPWTADKEDYLVLVDGRVIGRIFQQPQAPEGRPWMWTITACEKPPSIHNRGYSATREEAMKDFKAQWLSDTAPQHFRMVR